MRRANVLLAAAIALILSVMGRAQQMGNVVPLPGTLPVMGTPEQRVKATAVRGLQFPWALAFLPDGDILVTERPGRLRRIHDFTLDPKPIAGIPETLPTRFGGLWDIALHPRFSENRLIYFTFARAMPNEKVPPGATGLQGPSGVAVLGRARLDGYQLTDYKELFVSNTYISGATSARIVFARDGKLFMSIGSPSRDQAHGGPNRVGTAESAQDPASHAGKILRLNDDGSVPSDNPFVGKPGYQPQIYALGIRNALGLILHPRTGELMDAEHGPNGGDEVNFIEAGHNYGWPVISYGRAYGGALTQGGSGPERSEPCAPGMDQPFIFWAPNIMPGGMTYYTGDKFPAWKDNLFVSGLGSTQLHRVVFNGRGLPVRREALLTELKQRIRDVRQGPDGLLYMVTDMEDGALLRIEPAGN